jgi:beta propeller repeat protein
LALAVPSQSNQLTINETQITGNASGPLYPNIYGERIVWFDSRNLSWEIHTYELSTSRETSVPINGTMPYSPVIYRNRIVWGDVIFPAEYPLPVVYLYDFSTSKQTQVSANGAAMSPALYGDRIVWMDSRNNGKKDYSDSTIKWDIYLYNLSTSKETQLFPAESLNILPVICEDSVIWTDPRTEGRINYWSLAGNWNTSMYRSSHNGSSQMFPVIYRDRIVWMDSRNGGSGNYWNLTGNWDIYMYNLSTHKETQITTDESMQAYPAVYGENIVWLDSRNGNWEVYGYNFSTSREIQINATRPWQYYHPSIYEDKIVWLDFCERNWEIYMYDLSSSQETQITTNSSNSQSPACPAIYGNRIVWEDERNGNRNIYMYTVSEADTGSSVE